MLTKFKTWFFNLFKSAEHELSLEAVKSHVSEVVAEAVNHVAVLIVESRSNANADLKKYIGEEICKRYDSLVADAGKAARLMEHSKIVMAACDYCHLPSRRFSISKVDGKTICSSCAAKGIN
jgi:hypothetical protein